MEAVVGGTEEGEEEEVTVEEGVTVEAAGIVVDVEEDMAAVEGVEAVVDMVGEDMEVEGEVGVDLAMVVVGQAEMASMEILGAK